MNKIGNIATIIFVIVIAVISVRQCEKEPEIITKTETIYINHIDTITKVQIQEKVIVRYVDRVKTLKGKDSIIYRKDTSGIKANEYSTQLESNNATADLKILTTGALLNVQGIIKYQEKLTTVTEYKNNSGLFLYGQTSVIPDFRNVQIGVDYVMKNKIIIGTSLSYNNQAYLNVKFGFRIF